MKYVDENALRQNITETKDYVDSHGFASDRTPIGTIISVGCNSSLIPSSTIKYPTDDYFICKGTTLNIAEYPALADYFEDAFGSKNYFGGDGTTTFKVPDFTVDFPTNGILAIKAQMTGTQITYAEVNDSITTANNVWSASKVNAIAEKLNRYELIVCSFATSYLTALGEHFIEVMGNTGFFHGTFRVDTTCPANTHIVDLPNKYNYIGKDNIGIFTPNNQVYVFRVSSNKYIVNTSELSADHIITIDIPIFIQ